MKRDTGTFWQECRRWVARLPESGGIGDMVFDLIHEELPEGKERKLSKGGARSLRHDVICFVANEGWERSEIAQAIIDARHHKPYLAGCGALQND